MMESCLTPISSNGKVDSSIPAILLSLFDHLERERIVYCLIRDFEQLDQFSRGGEIDLLVHAEQIEQLQKLLNEIGFVSLPSLGYLPHHFFIAYDENCDAWFKLDVVTEIYFGKPINALCTSLARNCLDRRRESRSIVIPSPEDELITLVLHCVIDNREFKQTRKQRLRMLRRLVSDEQYLTSQLAAYLGKDMTWKDVRLKIDREQWDELLLLREDVSKYLASQDRLGTLYRSIRNRLVRKINGLVNTNYPHSLMVALLAPDGAGKTTLAHCIQQKFYFPTRILYMGLYHKGSRDLFLDHIPGIGLFWRLLIQYRRYLTGRFHRMRRRLVLFDRYAYDAWLTYREDLSWSKRFRRKLLARACPPPDAVFLLDLPGDVLYQRKQEHSVTQLEKQRQLYLSLRSEIPNLILVDATQDAGNIRKQIMSLIWKGYLGQQLGVNTIYQVMTK